MTGTQKIAFSTAKIYLSQFIGAGFRAITFIIMLNIMGSVFFGLFSLSIATALMIQLGTIGGTSWTINVFFSLEKENRQKALTIVILAIAFLFSILIGLFVFFPVQISQIIVGGEIVFLGTLLLFPIIAIRAAATSVLHGTSNFSYEALSTVISSIVLGSMILLLIQLSILTLPLAFVIYVLSELIGFLIQLLRLRKVVSLELPTLDAIKETVRYSKFSQSTTLMITLGREGSLIFLGVILSEVAVSSFNMANILSSPLLYLGSAIAVVLVPFASKNQSIRKAIAGEGLKHLLIMGLVSTLLVWWLSPTILPLLFIEYEGLIPLVNLTWLAASIGAVSQALRPLVYSMERFQDDLISIIISTLTVFLTFLLLVGELGILAIAYAYLIKNSTWSVAIFCLLRKQDVVESTSSLLKGLGFGMGGLGIFLVSVIFFVPFISGIISILILIVVGLVTGLIKEEFIFWRGIIMGNAQEDILDTSV
ncbi:MAG: membrane protein of unknown function [Candidatus Thorarchaeota archaeon]|nr:MAG: membrane protein of unknown function [Candidatus Thorarchaeota archaeon]